MMKKAKEKKHIAPNECSLFRWLLVLLLSLVGMGLFAGPFVQHAENYTDTFMGISYATYHLVFSLAAAFLAFVLGLKWIAKTSVKDFILGVQGKFNFKLALLILGLNAGGILLSYLLNIKHLSWRGVQPGQYLFLLAFALLIVWMQTTVEEFMFRGLVLRWVCKNNIGYSKKAMIAAVISSFVFMLGHITGAEITSQSGWNVVLMLCNYFFYGFIYFWADIHFGSLLPGIVMHWCNNFVIHTMVTQEVSTVANPTLLIDHTPREGWQDLLSVILAHLPLMIYIVVDIIRKRKKAASAPTLLS